jgi:arylsulfatase
MTMNSDSDLRPGRRAMLQSGSSLLGVSVLGTSYAAALPKTVQMAQASEQAAAPTSGKPNIVLVLMDNLGYGELGVYGGGILRGAPTPRLDGLAADGMHLLNFNIEAQCTPSRAALLTGRYAVRTGNGSVPIDTPLYGLVQWEITLPELLSTAGYATGAFGKWHLGQTAGRYPTDQGFDEWYGIPNSTDEAYWADSPLFRPNSDPLRGSRACHGGKERRGSQKS